MTQHPHKAIIAQWADDPSREIERQGIGEGILGPKHWYPSGMAEVLKYPNHTFRIKPRPHPNDVYREAYERGEKVWVRCATSSPWSEALPGATIAGWFWTYGGYEFTLTDPNPVDEYAHLREALKEGKKIAHYSNADGSPGVRSYKIVEPDEITLSTYEVQFKSGIRRKISVTHTLSGLTGKVTSEGKE